MSQLTRTSEPNSDEKNTKNTKLMKDAKRLYLQGMGKQLTQFQHLLELVEHDFKVAEDIYLIVHTIKGSAPVFGFIRAGLIAEQVVPLWEWALKESEDASALYLADIVEKTKVFLEQLVMEYEIFLQEIDLDQLKEHNNRGILSLADCRLLVIDDDDVLRSYMVRRLELDGYLVDHAADVNSARLLLHENKYDLITLDLMMMPQSGYVLFEFLKVDPTLKWLPLIVLSGREDVQDKVRCFHLGADDYVTKPFHYEELAARIYSLLLRTKSFEQMAFYDPLTGISNRRYFDHQLQSEIERAERYQAPLSLCFIDIDKFKIINDTHGHHIGDLILQGLAHLIQQNLRSSDLVARFGGEEFVVVLPNSNTSEAQRIIENILEKVHQEPVAQNEGKEYYIAFSAGIALWNKEKTKEQWIRQADSAMYQAKQQGRNRVLVYGGQFAPFSTDLPMIEKPKRILIVDDDTILRSIVVSRLESLPVVIQLAKDIMHAYEILRKQPADLCILDGYRPEQDGFGLIELLHEDRDWKPNLMKILMLTARKKEEDTTRGLKVTIDDYMAKPFSLVELELRVKHLLQIGDSSLGQISSRG